MATKGRSIIQLWGEPLETPMARLWLIFSPRGLRMVQIVEPERQFRPSVLISIHDAEPSLRSWLNYWVSETVPALQDYFAGTPPDFSNLTLDWQGTFFQRRVWEAVRRIPVGATASYGDLARVLGLPKGARAVGGALKANPLPIIIPCHRIVRANGSLGGFSAGLSYKHWLLAHEQAMLTPYQASSPGVIQPYEKPE